MLPIQLQNLVRFKHLPITEFLFYWFDYFFFSNGLESTTKFSFAYEKKIAVPYLTM